MQSAEVKTMEFSVDDLPAHSQEYMFKTIISGANRMFKDEAFRAEYEQWKKNRK